MFYPVKIPPGVVLVDSDYAAMGRWIGMDKVRFDKDLPEKLGGVVKFTPLSFEGIARGAYGWVTSQTVQCLAFGTACNLYVFRDNLIRRITPYRADAIERALTDPFTMVNGSAVVTVNDVNHGIAEAGTFITFDNASEAGGITIDGDYAVTSVIDTVSYTITHSAPATSDAVGGGDVLASYEINCGQVDIAYLLGYGVGGYGDGGYGDDADPASALRVDPRYWSMDTYGENLVVCPVGGALYYYDAAFGANRPTVIQNSPVQNLYVFVTPERYIVTLGCTDLNGVFDKMMIRWPDIEDMTDWTPSADGTDTANARRLQGGSRLIAGTGLSDGISLIWSDAAAFLMQFTQTVQVYSTRRQTGEAGLVGPSAWAKANGMAFWMGPREFWMFAGYVQKIPNSENVRKWVFDNINQEQLIKVISWYDPGNNEVWWIFPAGDSTEPNTYVMVRLDNFEWANGTWTRTAAAVFPSVENRPILFGADGYIYAHEDPDSHDEDGAPMEAFIELAPTNIRDGNVSADIFGFVPDFQRQAGNLTLYLYGRDHPRDTDFMTDTVTVTPTDKLVDTRAAGRQFGFKLTSDVLGGDFRLGKVGIEVSEAGERR